MCARMVLVTVGVHLVAGHVVLEQLKVVPTKKQSTNQ